MHHSQDPFNPLLDRGRSSRGLAWLTVMAGPVSRCPGARRWPGLAPCSSDKGEAARAVGAGAAAVTRGGRRTRWTAGGCRLSGDLREFREEKRGKYACPGEAPVQSGRYAEASPAGWPSTPAPRRGRIRRQQRGLVIRPSRRFPDGGNPGPVPHAGRYPNWRRAGRHPQNTGKTK
jgi:hypothetical protein